MIRKDKALSLILCLLLCLLPALTACGTGQGADREVLRGRYMEEERPLPENLEEILTLDQMADGSLWLLGLTALVDGDGEPRGEYRIWSSPDGGGSWREEQYTWLEEINGDLNGGDGYIINACFAAPEELYVGMNVFGGADTGTDSIALRGDRDTLTPCEYTLLAQGREGTVTSPQEILYTESGILLNYYDYIKRIDPATGDELARYQGEMNLLAWGTIAAGRDMVAAVEIDRITLYDLDSGAVAAELAYSGGAGRGGGSFGDSYGTVPVFQADGSALFYANETGIYRALLDGSLTEKVLDGALVSIGMPTYDVQRLFHNADGSFLVQCREAGYGGYRLFRYAYDTAVPTVPGKELRVYSLRDSRTVRDTIGRLQLQDPDVLVSYQVGMGNGDANTVSDALRTLATELLAEDGPDILVLDGLPVDAYIARGVLLDLQGYLEETIDSGALLPNVADTFRLGGALYAVPTRCAVPVMHGADIGAVTDLRGLADWLEERGGSIRVDAATVMERFYDICAPGWFREVGALDETRFREDLRDLMRLTEEPQEGDFYDSSHDLAVGALQMMAGEIHLNLAWVTSLEDLQGPCALIRETGEGQVSLFPGEGVYRPGLVLGVNAASGEIDLAVRFVELALSEEMQASDFGEGLPVNTAALEQQITTANPHVGTSMSYTVADPETGGEKRLGLQLEKPDAADLRGFVEQVGRIETASPENLAVRQIVLEETLAYFTGDLSLDDTVAALGAKLHLYLAE